VACGGDSCLLEVELVQVSEGGLLCCAVDIRCEILLLIHTYCTCVNAQTHTSHKAYRCICMRKHHTTHTFIIISYSQFPDHVLLLLTN